jgi:cellulose synthase/poly-beta-1,6-N-acetylglucosamine synthase-like glycosyltransferase
MSTLRCSVGVTAHNEEANIGKLLDALLEQELYAVEIAEIIVVASGCEDGTEAIVREYAEQDSRIRLIVQARREGKSAAVNEIVRAATEEIVVIESGDTLPRRDSIENLVRPFRDPTVGMTGAQKVPVNASDQFVGYLSHLRLQLEHQLCLEVPRLGELIAFRREFGTIPPDVAMDEAFIESIVIKGGQKVIYAPMAVVFNMGPTTVGDFITQRRRNYAGHLHLKRKYGYKVSSLNNGRVLVIATGEFWRLVRMVLFMFWAGGLEGISRALGSWDYYVRRKKHVVWQIAETTKDVDEERARSIGAGLPRARLKEPVEAREASAPGG